jgi:hypothetical protein
MTYLFRYSAATSAPWKIRRLRVSSLAGASPILTHFWDCLTVALKMLARTLVNVAGSLKLVMSQTWGDSIILKMAPVHTKESRYKFEHSVGND